MEWSPEARDAAVKARFDAAHELASAKNALAFGQKKKKRVRADLRMAVKRAEDRLDRESSISEEINKVYEKITLMLFEAAKEAKEAELPNFPTRRKLEKDFLTLKTKKGVTLDQKNDDQVIAIGRQKRLNKDDDDDDASEARIVRKTKKNEKIGGKALPDGPPQYKQPDDEAEAELDAEDEGPMEDQDWIQKAVNPKHKGYCTPMTKDTCTPARKALAKRFKKAARKEKKSGGTGWEGKV